MRRLWIGHVVPVWVVALLAAACTAALGQRAALPAEQPLTFASVKITQGDDPHAYGPQIELFKHGSTWSGFIAVYTGLVADPPSGRLDPLQVDERTGKLTFTAKLSTGVSRQGNDWVPTRDVYEFSGQIDAKTVSGTLTQRNDADAARAGSRDTVVLERQLKESAPSSYEGWIQLWTTAMKVRGPKW